MSYCFISVLQYNFCNCTCNFFSSDAWFSHSYARICPVRWICIVDRLLLCSMLMYVCNYRGSRRLFGAPLLQDFLQLSSYSVVVCMYVCTSKIVHMYVQFICILASIQRQRKLRLIDLCQRTHSICFRCYALGFSELLFWIVMFNIQLCWSWILIWYMYIYVQLFFYLWLTYRPIIH
jgi:hypothetical protein